MTSASVDSSHVDHGPVDSDRAGQHGRALWTRKEKLDPKVAALPVFGRWSNCGDDAQWRCMAADHGTSDPGRNRRNGKGQNREELTLRLLDKV